MTRFGGQQADRQEQPYHLSPPFNNIAGYWFLTSLKQFILESDPDLYQNMLFLISHLKNRSKMSLNFSGKFLEQHFFCCFLLFSAIKKRAAVKLCNASFRSCEMPR
jgi:hypothetical protein